jgi:hypothetical protein
VSVYLDTSVVVALFVESDAFTARARQYVSIAAACPRTCTALFADRDAWISQVGETVGTTAFDVAAIASRLGATLATFDDQMANAARTLGLQDALA